MSSASRRAARLADHLCRETGLDVDVSWLCVHDEDWFVVTWSDGPDEASLRELAARHGGVAQTQVHCVRELTPIASANALLLWLIEHPDHLDSVSALTMTAAHSQVPYPERVPDRIAGLARALLGLSATGELDDETLALIVPHARNGWTAFASWLESTTMQARNVVDLAAERRRRRSTR